MDDEAQPLTQGVGVVKRGGLPENADGTPFVLDFGPAPVRPRTATVRGSRPDRWAEAAAVLAEQFKEDG